MSIQIELADDEALVLFELLSSRTLENGVEVPERNALWALEGLLEKQLVAPFSDQYAELLRQARASLVTRYGS